MQSDNGAAMKPLSNDDPFSESQSKAMKESHLAFLCAFTDEFC